MFIPIVYYLCPTADIPFGWFFFKAIDMCGEHGWPVVAQCQYFEKSTQILWQDELCKLYDISPIHKVDLGRVRNVVIPAEIEKRFIEQWPSLTDAFQHTVTDDWPELEDFLVDRLTTISKEMQEPIEGLISLKKMPFIENVAKRLSVTPIYFEIGPYRTPLYRMTLFLDQRGLFGQASIEERYKAFQRECKNKAVLVFSKQELLLLFMTEDGLNFLEKDKQNEYDIGIAAGNSTPLFTSPFNAVTLPEMIYRVSKLISWQKIGIKLHPGDSQQATPRGYRIDESKTSAEFINKCRRVVCAASNISFEASLYGVPAYDIGWSQFGFAVNTSLKNLEDRIMSDELLNFISFAILIPIEFWKDIEFLRYWLSCNSEIELYNYILDYYLACIGLTQKELSCTNRVEVILAARQGKYQGASSGVFHRTVRAGERIELARLELVEKQFEKMQEDYTELKQMYVELEQNCEARIRDWTIKNQETQETLITQQNLLAKYRDELSELKNENEQLNKALSLEKQRFEKLQKEYMQILYSKSYRLTEPLRKIIELTKKQNEVDE